ncbi:type II toxin-antitoxin system RelE family toxin [Planctomicrobium sp. SH661]|uniref:type II toxin-antitoxin system RelE family toxin n=1 Tax=Planctomicrobium sp. SH661 TaxID=3448124 RepID=UPI003F5B8C2D
MGRYSIELTASADKALQALPVTIQKRIVRAIEPLSDDPRPPGVVKIAGDDNAWRIRVGDYRIVYEIHNSRLLVLVIRIGHRRDIYRKGK